MGTAVVSTLVASSQRAADAALFSEATAEGSRNAFLLLALMMMAAFVITLVMTSKRKNSRM